MAYPGQAFRSAPEAAIDALSSIYDYSNQVGHEFGGYIYHDFNGNYYASSPHSVGSACSLPVPSLPAVPAGYAATAFYHTHPYYLDADAENFSAIPGDKFTATFHNLNMFIMTPSKAVKQFIPANLTADPARWPSGVVYTNVYSQTAPLTYQRYLPPEC